MANKATSIFVGAGLLALGVFLVMKRKTLSTLATSALDEANREIFLAVTPSAVAPYYDVIKQVAEEQGVDPFVIAALGWQESGWTTRSPYTPLGDPCGTGDAGHGHGIMQIDDGTWSSWLASNDWCDPMVNVTKGAQIFRDNLDRALAAGLTGDFAVQAAIGAYNHGGKSITNAVQGLSPDAGLPNPNYSSTVWNLVSSWSDSFSSMIA